MPATPDHEAESASGHRSGAESGHQSSVDSPAPLQIQLSLSVPSYSEDIGGQGYLPDDHPAREDYYDDDEYTPLLGPGHQPQSDRPPRLGKWTIWKNLLSLSLSYTFVYTSYASLQNLESSLHLTTGIGVTTLSCVFAGMCISSLYAPLMIRFLGTKYTMIMLFVAQALFAAAHYSPTYYTLIPAAILLGLISSPAAASESVYIANMAREYAFVTGEVEPEPIIAWFNGIYLAFFQITQVTGNLISSTVLKANENSTAAGNLSTEMCGGHFCPGDNLSSSANFKRPPDNLVNTLVSIFVVFCVIGVLLMLIVMDRCRALEKATAGKRLWMEDILGTILSHIHPWLACLILLFFWTGVEQAFLYSEYTEAFVSCHMGVSDVGYAMIGFGVGDVVGSVLVGRIEKRCGRPLLFTLAAIVNIALYVTMLIWKPSDGPNAILYVIPVFWGLTDAVWQIITTALIATEFPGMQESAFAMFRMWQAAGFTVMFAISHFLCMHIKIYINLAVLLLAMTLYAVGEHGIRHDKSRPWVDLYIAI